LSNYNANDQLTTDTYDADGNTTASNGNGYVYDFVNQLIQQGGISIVYDGDGNRVQKTAAGVTTKYLVDTQNPTGYAQVVYETWQHGRAGNRAQLRVPGRTVNYSYDDLYRLTNETIAGGAGGMNGSVTYSYDAVGNRKQKVSTLPGYPGGLTNYNGNDQLSTDTYDANGNTTASGQTGYVYDFENHLVSANGIAYTYDGDGHRVSKTVNGTATTYATTDINPTGYSQVVGESYSPRVNGGEYQHSYIYGLDAALELRQYLNGVGSILTQQMYFVHDGHGSVRAVTDQNGAVTDTYDYDAFGVLIHSTGTTPNTTLYSGEQFDPDLGLYYNRARYLNSNTGRFWTTDEEDGNGYDPASLHKYLYAQANPVSNVDPTGHASAGEATFAAGAEQSIGAEGDYTTIRIFQTLFRTTAYAGDEVVYSQPSILLRAIAALTATVVTAASVFEAFSSPGELPDVAASQQNQDNLFPIVLFRDVDGTGKGEFRWRGPDRDPDGLSFFESPFRNPVSKRFSVGFRAKYSGLKRNGAPGGFVEQELLNIPIFYSPNLGGEGHWSVPVTSETAPQYEEKFSQAAKRIKAEDPNRFPRNPNM
jgi:RHS repeat-associated protein